MDNTRFIKRQGTARLKIRGTAPEGVKKRRLPTLWWDGWQGLVSDSFAFVIGSGAISVGGRER